MGFAQFFMVLAFILMIYPVAKCHFTPILSFASILFQHQTIENGLILVLSQLIGTVMGTSFVALTIDIWQNEKMIELDNDLGFAHIQKPHNSFNGFLSEILFSSLLVYVFLQYSMSNKHNAVLHYGIIRALVVLLASVSGESYCGVSMNPFQIITGTLLTGNLLNYQWVYLISPFIGVGIGGLVYQFSDVKKFFRKVKEQGKLKDLN